MDTLILSKWLLRVHKDTLKIPKGYTKDNLRLSLDKSSSPSDGEKGKLAHLQASLRSPIHPLVQLG